MYSRNGYDILIAGEVRSAIIKLVLSRKVLDIEMFVVRHYRSKYYIWEELLNMKLQEKTVILEGCK